MILFGKERHVGGIGIGSGQLPETSQPNLDIASSMARAFDDDQEAQDGFTTNPPSPTPGLKFDDGKPALGLYSGEFLCLQGAVLEFGRQKYTKDGVDGANNWRKGLYVTKLIGAIIRHACLALMGEDFDEESKLPHMAHVAIDAMMAWETMAYRKTWDDRVSMPFKMPLVKK